jgi:hypothetical protein
MVGINDDGMHDAKSVGLVQGTTAMRRPRFTIRRRMILVAVLAAASLIGRVYRDRSLRHDKPITGSTLGTTVDALKMYLEEERLRASGAEYYVARGSPRRRSSPSRSSIASTRDADRPAR